MIVEKYSPAYLEGIDSFNRGAYFDAHDRWEECWIAAGRPAHGFFKGLIQAAVAMHHLSKGNRSVRKNFWNDAANVSLPAVPCVWDSTWTAYWTRWRLA